MQIIVLGMHRSGTSLITRLINMMGAYFAQEGMSLGFSKDNPKGFWERQDVMRLNDALLQHFGAHWRKVDTFKDDQVEELPQPLRRVIRTIVLEMDAHRPWVLKDPRLCLTLPYWLPALEVPVAVIAWRDPLEAAQSLMTRNGISIPHGLALWEYHAVHTIRHAHALPKVFAQYQAMIDYPMKSVRILYDALLEEDVQGLRVPSEREVLGFIEPTLHRARKEQLSEKLNAHQQLLSSMLRGETKFDPKMEISAEAKKIMANVRNA